VADFDVACLRALDEIYHSRSDAASVGLVVRHQKLIAEQHNTLTSARDAASLSTYKLTIISELSTYKLTFPQIVRRLEGLFYATVRLVPSDSLVHSLVANSECVTTNGCARPTARRDARLAIQFAMLSNPARYVV